jgi:hypothetical protein
MSLTIFLNELCIVYSLNINPVEEYMQLQKSGNTIEYAGASMGYRVYRTTRAGRHYGFVTCGHSVRRSVDNKIYHGTDFGIVIGVRRISKYSGSTYNPVGIIKGSFTNEIFSGIFTQSFEIQKALNVVPY